MSTKQYLFYIIIILILLVSSATLIIGQSKRADTASADSIEWGFQKTEFTTDKCPIYKIFNTKETRKENFLLVNLNNSEEKIILEQCKDVLSRINR